jgi:serine/threonine protein kinase
MIATDSCLTHDQLRDLAAGKLPGDRFERLIEHLDACPDCQQRAEQIESLEDSLAAALASRPTVDSHAAEPACAAALYACSQEQKNPIQAATPPVDQLGAYQLIRPLGSGGMGAVFLARHTRLRRQCAVKLLPRDRGFDTAWRERFDREMAAVAALNNPHVVAASDAGEADGWHFLVMEYLEGLDLSRLAGRLGRLPLADACELIRQAAVGLEHVHSAGLVHRDIKPSNLMLTRHGVVKILDLGLVLSDHDPLPTDDRLTTVGQLMGTLAYMAPEQLADSTAVDHRADLYALGATLYRLLAGTPPHGSARGIAPLVLAKTRHPAPELGKVRADLPESLNALVRGLLDRDPKRRPNSAATIAEALHPHTSDADPENLIRTAQRKRPSPDESFGSRSPFPAARVAVEPPPREPWNRRRMLAAAAGLPLLLLATITLIVMTDRGQLVIESEAAGLDVSIQQGDEVVEQLQLTTGDNRVTLRSGTYTVGMDAKADGVRLSGRTVTVTRGDETVLRVRRISKPSLETPVDGSLDDGPLYRGEPFEHWLTVLENERDVETVIDAMKAVVELSRGEQTTAGLKRQMTAAASMLEAARRYGGMVSTGPGVQHHGLESPSGRFMGHLLALYPASRPDVMLGPIGRELADGNEKSSMAAIWLLYNYTMEITYDELYAPKFGQLQEWSKRETGMEILRKLASNIDLAAQRLGGYATSTAGRNYSGRLLRPKAMAVHMAYELRLRINQLLGVDSLDDPVIGDRLRQSVEDAVAHSRKLFEKAETPPTFTTEPGPEPWLSEWEVKAVVGKMPPETVAWAAVPTLVISHFRDPDDPLEILHRLEEKTPQATADAGLGVLAARGVRSSVGSIGP